MSVLEKDTVQESWNRKLTGSEPWKRLRANRAAIVAIAIVALLLVLSIVGPWFAPNPNVTSPADAFQGPSGDHWLGADQLGRDLLARTLIGGRVSFLVAVSATAVAFAVAMAIGMLAGYLGGWIDAVISRIFDIMLTFPTFVMAIVVAAALGPSLVTVIIAIAFPYLPSYGRLFRAQAMAIREREFIQAGVALGFSSLRTMARHVFPNLVVPIVVVVAGNIGKVALTEASLSYLGVGVQPPDASWGNMIASGQSVLQFYPWLALIPGCALTAVAVSFGFIGDGLRDAFGLREDIVSEEG